jgi:hypothetical protein
MLLAIAVGCGQDETIVTPSTNTNQSATNPKVYANGWSVPIEQVVDGGVGKDGIRSIDEPNFTPVDKVDFLEDSDLVILVNYNNILKVYPVKILDYHEVVNDIFADARVTISHCPLTGTSVAWAGKANGLDTDYGVSGLLFNNNLILYDRQTDGYWSQMMAQAIFGERVLSNSLIIPAVETTWSTFKSTGYSAMVMNLDTGFGRNYSRYPYGDYKNDDSYILFPLANPSNDLAAKARVHLIISSVDDEQSALVVPLDRPHFIEHDGMVIIGDETLNYMVSFLAEAEDGTPLIFQPNISGLPAILTDQEGNVWDLFGEATEGPRKGEHLQPTYSMMSYWFPITSIFNPTEIIRNHPTGG